MESPRVLARPRTQALLQHAKEALGALNEDIRNETPTYQGLVLFSEDTRHTNTANAVFSLDGDGVPAEALRFRRDNIDGRRVLLAATALGDILRDGHNQFAASRLTNGAQMTWGGIYPSAPGSRMIVQTAFSMTEGGDLPSSNTMDTLWHHHLPAVGEAVDAVQRIVPPGESLGDALELHPPVTPNAYIIRWDIVNSTLLASSHFGALRSYQQHVEQAFARILSHERYVDNYQGDGQNIIFRMTGINYDDEAAVKLFGTQHIAPVIEAMHASHRAIAAHYRDIAPNIRISIGLGFVEEDHRGNLTGPVFSEIAKQPTTDRAQLPQAILDILDRH